MVNPTVESILNVLQSAHLLHCPVHCDDSAEVVEVAFVFILMLLVRV